MLLRIALLCTAAWAIEITFTVKPKQNQCFGDRLAGNVLVVGSVTSNVTHFQTRIYEPMKGAADSIHQAQGTLRQPFSFTTEAMTKLQVCVSNFGKHNVVATLKYNTGTEAFDYTMLADKGDVQQIRQQINKLKDITKGLKVINSCKNPQQEIGYDAIQYLSYKFTVASLVTLALMVLTTMCSAWRIRKFLRNKKLI